MPQPSSEQPARNSVIQEKNDHLNLQDVGDKGHTGRRRENNPKSARLSRIQFPGLTRGRESRGAWLTLDRTVFQSVTKKASASRILAATPADLQHQVETDLATRVLDEVHKTSASLDEESSSSLRECGSRSERPIRCIEWNGLGRLSASPSPGEEHSTLAAVLIFSGQTRAAPKPHSMIVAPDAATAQPSDGISRDEQLPSAPMAEVKSLVEELGKDVGVPVYDIDSLFVDESDRHQHINEFLSLLRPSAERSSPKSALASINAEVQEAETLSGRPMVFEVHKHAYTRDLLIALARLAFYHGRE
ncbi:hypothetical protein IE81DRAFT_349479 [Ceraceosorus guamensis]|uniref:Uncharacterized protein n=1 Tax=Ceraceosorus guamensis TaxID=1522189 RepID=A0A316VRS0_9BASI|nr:hypothetical protein IE81DRAFT_349479 [Ceraceosorus guamensis]PWN40202.1 hypothetical protein IE81DRAFT_349479 [Ceraceosorus guamensis]